MYSARQRKRRRRCQCAGSRPAANKFKTRILVAKISLMYKVGSEDVVGDASAEGSNRRPGPKGKAQGAVRVAVFGLRSS